VRKRYSRSTLIDSGRSVPWLAADGPLAYTPEDPPATDYLFQYSWIVPEIFDSRVNKRCHHSEGCAIEELVAELGAAFLCADVEVTLEPREDHADWIANWLDVLKADNRAIFAAVSHAPRAADFMNCLQPASAV
jgi:Zincin-like metallopeptidase